MLKLDYSQYKCPYPVIETRKQMLANPESALNVLVGDQAGRDNVARLADKMGYQSSVTTEGKLFCLTLTPAESPETKTQVTSKLQKPDSPAAEKTIVYCGSDRMGQGDDEFGQLLMRNFITTQLEMDPLPDMILFVNSGINLTTEGSEVLEALSKLSEKGVDLASCGLCLDFYEKKDQLKIGRITNMYEIADVQNCAARIICP